jgi:hypothetical protein
MRDDFTEFRRLEFISLLRGQQFSQFYQDIDRALADKFYGLLREDLNSILHWQCKELIEEELQNEG